ncbi:MAG TPA: complex I NDUFA9 subunit family protein [Steroidobacteraceae bacterium]|nr:complex I NDUFA9 subunit family protein [Steroidobacteraceae bacterium]
MNVLLTGASGFIGSHLARALRAAEYVVIEAHREVAAGTAAVRADFTRDLSAREWLPKLIGVDAVINAVGILREHGEQTFDRIHKRAPQALFTACVAAGVRRVVQISALGADLGTTRYFVSKRAADDYLATLPLDWTIVRPAIVFGPGGSSARLFERLAHLPVVPLPGRGEQQMQPIHVDDLTEAVVRILGDASTSRTRIELVGPQSLSLRELLASLRTAMHLRPARFLQIPMPLVRVGARVAGVSAMSPLDSETLSMLEAGTHGDPTATRSLLGREPRAVAAATYQ